MAGSFPESLLLEGVLKRLDHDRFIIRELRRHAQPFQRCVVEAFPVPFGGRTRHLGNFGGTGDGDRPCFHFQGEARPARTAENMTLPFSSELPDAVQKLLGLSGAAGTVEKALLGILMTAAAAWGLFKGILWIRKHKP